MNNRPAPFQWVQFTDAALDDLRSINDRARPVLMQVFTVLKRLDAGQVRPTPLRDFAKTGDLTDCGKLVVHTDGHPEYRIVVRSAAGVFEVSEVICVEERTDDLASLLAGIRLGRIANPLRRSDTQRRIARIRAARQARQARPSGD